MSGMYFGLILIAVALNAIVVLVVVYLTRRNQPDLGRVLVEELKAGREDSRATAKELRDEVSARIHSGIDLLSKNLQVITTGQQSLVENLSRQLTALSESNQSMLDRIRQTLDGRIRELQEGNEKKLDEMRKTVDEKLHNTLEKRLGESFKIVSDQLEAVHKGLGEMQSLAAGVGDLKRVLSNVKARGAWAEVQLGGLLDQVLTPDQYAKNVGVKPNTQERVEFAIRLPGPKDDPQRCVWLPIDAKFPQDVYLRLQDAIDKADPAAVEKATEGIVGAIRKAAKDIYDKYVDPPNTTDFAIMFLATEGLYAEVLRQPALVLELQQKYRVVPAGPTTLFAILNSLRLGFQTLAIEKRASEVWEVLRAVKTEFARFGEVLGRVKKNLDTASRTIEQTQQRSRMIERKLRTVEQLPRAQAEKILEPPDDIGNVVGNQDMDSERDGEVETGEQNDQAPG